MKWRGLIGLALLGAVPLLVACRAPVSLKPAQPGSSGVQPVELISGVETLSEETRQLLRLYGLVDRLPEYPIAVVAVLRGLQGSSLAHVALAAEAEVAVLAARNSSIASSSEAAGWYLLAAARSYEFLFDGDYTLMERAMDPRFQRMRRVYNVSVSSYVGLQKDILGGIRDHQQVTRFELFQVDVEQGSDRLNPRDPDTLLVARELEIRGLRNRYRRDGLGAALVWYRANQRENATDRFFVPEGMADPVTAVLEFGLRGAELSSQARTVKLSFYDPRETETVTIGSLAVPLQADFSTHLAYLASISPISSIGRKGLMNPDQWDERMGLYLTEAYDPEKIPVVMIHGLRSSPLAWMELTNDLFGDPLLRERYQVWQFYYPTALPYLHVGQVLRHELDSVRVELDPEGDDPAMQSMVFIAHSMGGLVTRALICDSGMKLWDRGFKVPPDQIRGSLEDAEWLRGMFLFTHQPFIDRVIFIATPHLGAARAAGLLGQMSSSLVDLPDSFVERAERLRMQNQELITPAWTEMIKKGPPNSIRALRPENPLLQVFGTLPIAPGIEYHTIMGDGGLRTEGPITDGWVDYESVHLEDAASELIVPSGHAAYVHPATIAEIKRILRLHLRER